ncbi:MAG: galactose mutarotase, partial [Bacteroidetes bacterium]|nr:galactose mutarotase [Bacteroidota bacterium]
MKKLLFAVAALALIFVSCKKQDEKTASGLLRSNFQTVIDGDSTDLYVLKNASGAEVCITNYGGRIVSVMVPDKNGVLQDVVLGFDSIADYINVPSDFGASIGRYANRINQGRIVIDGDTIQLPQNNFGHCLHGGPKGWQYQVYQMVNQPNDSTIELTRFSPDGDQNFPGSVTAKVTFKLTADNAIEIDFEATTDKKTVINMCNHSYFNLSGDPNNTITEDILYVNADRYTPVDSTFMTTGAIDSVKGTPMDFVTAKPIGQDIDKYDFEQLKNGNGYDHNWVLNTA